jgi:transcriptional regulator with XRE-family HTH domain
MDKKALREALKKFGIRQAELASRLGVAEETVSRWANGHQKVPGYCEAYLSALDEQGRLRGVLSDIAALAEPER